MESGQLPNESPFSSTMGSVSPKGHPSTVFVAAVVKHAISLQSSPTKVWEIALPFRVVVHAQVLSLV